VIIDGQKTCGETPALVTQIMLLKKENFVIQKPMKLSSTDEQIWDLKPSVAESLGLRWLQLRFQSNKLQAVWFGPRIDLAKDLQRVGLKKRDLKNRRGQAVVNWRQGTYYSRDLDNRKIRIEHAGGPQLGTTLTCFPSQRY
jgi:hypothetical protein